MEDGMINDYVHAIDHQWDVFGHTMRDSILNAKHDDVPEVVVVEQLEAEEDRRNDLKKKKKKKKKG